MRNSIDSKRCSCSSRRRGRTSRRWNGRFRRCKWPGRTSLGHSLFAHQAIEFPLGTPPKWRRRPGSFSSAATEVFLNRFILLPHVLHKLHITLYRSMLHVGTKAHQLLFKQNLRWCGRHGHQSRTHSIPK